MPKQLLYARKQVAIKPQAKPVLSYWIPMVPGTLKKMLASTPKLDDMLVLCNKPPNSVSLATPTTKATVDANFMDVAVDVGKDIVVTSSSLVEV
ncbi:hypothetical protein V6N13_071747 [Hibiscus sabdariffa]